MPQVASDPKTHALKPLPRQLARLAPDRAQDRGQATPFASILDNGPQSPGDRVSQPPIGDNPSRSARSEPAQPAAKCAQPAAKSNSSNTASTSDNARSGGNNSAVAGNSGKTGKPDGDGKATSKNTASATGKTAGEAADGDTAKLVSDGKPADAAAATPTGPIQTLTGAAAVAVAAAPTTGAIQTVTGADADAPTPGSVPQAAPSAENAQIGAPATTKAELDLLAALQPGTAKKTDAANRADDPKLSARTAPPLHSDDKPQAAAGDTDKDAVAQARAEASAKDHRAASIPATGAPAADANTAAPKAAADAVPPPALTAPSQTGAASASNPAAAAPPPAPQTAAIPFAGVAIEIAGKALAGKNHFEIRLDPPELGRIEVRLDVDRDGNVTSRMIADRSDTLDLLRRDASGLERALQDAGLKTADNGLQFSLRDQSMGQQQARTPTPGATHIVVTDDALPADPIQQGYSRLAGQGSGVDIHV